LANIIRHLAARITMARTALRGRLNPRSQRISATTAAKVIRQLEAGLPFSAVEKLRRALDVPMERLAQITRISERTLARRKEEGKLNLDESERVYRLANVYERALSLFEGDQAAARRWLQTPRAAFGGKSALAFADTDVGAREVEDTIERIEYGVIA
jgi:putative toxin-antitoxin system antitoxin component (TIGR02293 family)